MAAVLKPRQHHGYESADKEVGSSTILALGDILADISAACHQEGPDSKDLEMFYSVSPPSLDIVGYLKRIMKYLQCGPETYVAASVYIRRIFNGRPDLPINKLSQHRLLLASAVVAAKAHNDEFLSNTFYAEVGGISRKDMNRLEVGFLKLLGWRTHVTREEYLEQLALLRAAAAAERRHTSFANWFRLSQEERSPEPAEPEQLLQRDAGANNFLVTKDAGATRPAVVQPLLSANRWVKAVIEACKPQREEEDDDSSSSASTAASTPPLAHSQSHCQCSREARETKEEDAAEFSSRKVPRTR